MRFTASFGGADWPLSLFMYNQVMEFGICVASRPSDIGYVQLAEQLGYSHMWAADSQWSGRCVCVYGAAATATTTMKLVPVLLLHQHVLHRHRRSHNDQRNCAQAGVLWDRYGNTAMRIMGHPPMRIAEFDRYLGNRSFLDGES